MICEGNSTTPTDIVIYNKEQNCYICRDTQISPVEPRALWFDTDPYTLSWYINFN